MDKHSAISSLDAHAGRTGGPATDAYSGAADGGAPYAGAADGGAPYAGAPGQTRYESVHLVQADGSLRSVAMCRAVNVRTHPELKARVLSGLLHRLDDGLELALPFVYHDPDARKFALVVAPMLAHTELKEWSKLMGEIAEDTRHAVPAYVKESATVLGIGALVRFLESDEARPKDSATMFAASSGERDALVFERERELAEQERSLIRMAETLTAREGELNRKEEQLETARVDIEIREAELGAELVSSSGAPPRVHVGAWIERSNFPEKNDATVVATISREMAQSSTFGAESDAPNSIGPHDFTRSVPPPLPRRTGGPPPLPHMTPRVAPPPLRSRRQHDEALTVVARPSEPPPLPVRSASRPAFDSTDFSALNEYTSPAEDNLDDVSAAVSGFGDAAVSGDEPATDADELAEPEPEPEVAPPSYFVSQSPGQMALKLAEDELWLFVQLDASREKVFRHGAELMLQYVETEGYPVAVLSIVDAAGDEPYAIRLALDGRAQSDVRVLEHLARSFRARVALYVEGLYFATVTVSTLREGVAAAICDKISELPRDHHSGLHPAEALMRVLHAPPPLWNDDLPFGPARRETPTTVAVLAAVEQLGSWLRPEKLAEATLTYSVPRNVIDASIRRVLRAAVVFGIALPAELQALATMHGVASDERALLRDQLQAFRLRVEQNENDLSAEVTRRNWVALLSQADALGLPVDDRARALADGSTAAADGGQLAADGGPDAFGSERPLERLSTAELRARLENPDTCVEAIAELCTRGHPTAIEPIFSVLEGLAPFEIATSTARLLAFGEAAGDVLITALGSASEPLRQCAALGLGRLKLRRALTPLLKQLENEESPAWPEMARAFGDFGIGALRAVVRAIPGSAQKDRLGAVLGHLANHGCTKDIEKLENDPDPDVAQVARRAMARRSRMEWEDLAVREQRTLNDANPSARLSQAFFAEAPKADI